MQATAGGYYDIVQYRLENGAVIARQDYTGRSALDLARNGRDRDVLKLLEQAESRR